MSASVFAKSDPLLIRRDGKTRQTKTRTQEAEEEDAFILKLKALVRQRSILNSQRVCLCGCEGTTEETLEKKAEIERKKDEHESLAYETVKQWVVKHRHRDAMHLASRFCANVSCARCNGRYTTCPLADACGVFVQLIKFLVRFASSRHDIRGHLETLCTELANDRMKLVSRFWDPALDWECGFLEIRIETREKAAPLEKEETWDSDYTSEDDAVFDAEDIAAASVVRADKYRMREDCSTDVVFPAHSRWRRLLGLSVFCRETVLARSWSVQIEDAVDALELGTPLSIEILHHPMSMFLLSAEEFYKHAAIKNYHSRQSVVLSEKDVKLLVDRSSVAEIEAVAAGSQRIADIRTILESVRPETDSRNRIQRAFLAGAKASMVKDRIKRPSVVVGSKQSRRDSEVSALLDSTSTTACGAEASRRQFSHEIVRIIEEGMPFLGHLPLPLLELIATCLEPPFLDARRFDSNLKLGPHDHGHFIALSDRVVYQSQTGGCDYSCDRTTSRCTLEYAGFDENVAKVLSLYREWSSIRTPSMYGIIDEDCALESTGCFVFPPLVSNRAANARSRDKIIRVILKRSKMRIYHLTVPHGETMVVGWAHPESTDLFAIKHASINVAHAHVVPFKSAPLVRVLRAHKNDDTRLVIASEREAEFNSGRAVWFCRLNGTMLVSWSSGSDECEYSMYGIDTSGAKTFYRFVCLNQDGTAVYSTRDDVIEHIHLVRNPGITAPKKSPKTRKRAIKQPATAAGETAATTGAASAVVSADSKAQASRPFTEEEERVFRSLPSKTDAFLATPPAGVSKEEWKRAHLEVFDDMMKKYDTPVKLIKHLLETVAPEQIKQTFCAVVDRAELAKAIVVLKNAQQAAKKLHQKVYGDSGSL